MAQRDVRSLPRIDQWFLGLGVVIFIASFLPWYGASYSGSLLGNRISSSASVTAWHGWAAFGLLLMLIATVVVAVQLLTDTTLPQLRLSWNIVVVTLDALGALIYLIRSLDLPSASGPGFSVGLRWGGWILLIAAIAQVIVAGLRFRATGESLSSWMPRGAVPPPPPPPAM